MYAVECIKCDVLVPIKGGELLNHCDSQGISCPNKAVK